MAIINKGKVLLQGNPLQLMNQLEGKIYKKSIAKNELDVHRKNFMVIADRLLLGKPIIHIYAEENPGHGFTPAETTLDDVYFSEISKNNYKR